MTVRRQSEFLSLNESRDYVQSMKYIYLHAMQPC